MRRITVLLILLLPLVTAFGKSRAIIVKNLKCEYLTNPAIVEDQHPVMSWQLLSPARSKSQKAYRILVAGNNALLAQNKGDYWDSGVVHSANSTQALYQGKALPSRTTVYWKVMVWDEKDQASAWSETASWTMGLLKAADWNAKWITNIIDPHPDSAKTYPAPFFRKEFVVTKKIKQAKVYVSGLGFYELYINGKKIGDQVLAPAVTNYDERPLKKLLYPYDDQSTQRVLYNSFDVTAAIQQHNAVGIVLGNGWYNQRDRTVEGTMWYDVPKLIFQLELQYTDGSSQIIGSDDSWKVSTGPLIKDGIFTGEQYDARLDLGHWNQQGYNDALWARAIEVKAPSGALHAQLAPFDKIIRTLKPAFLRRVNDSVYQYALPETIAGWAAIKVSGAAGSRIKIRYVSEEGQNYGQIDSYILNGLGIETWEPRFTWHAFRKIEITSGKVTLNAESVVAKDVHTDVQSTGSFECSNPLFNKIYNAYLRTQQANLHGSVSSDCPHRERLGYTGDGQVAMESALLSFDMSQFYRKWFNDMDDARNHKTGFVTHTAPFGGGGGGPAWGSAYVIMPWLYYTYYGNVDVLQRHYKGMKQWVEYLQTRTDKNGLISHEEPKGWCLGDWCTPDRIQLPEPLVNTAYFYHVANLVSRITGVLRNKRDQVKYANIAQQIKSDFNRAWYDSTTQTYWQGRQGADVFALAFGLVPDEYRADVFKSLVNHLQKLDYHFDTGILGTPLLLKVLSENDRDDIAYQLMDQRSTPGFSYLLDDRNSTLWETWDGKGSHTHPMFGSVVTWLYRSLGGINADELNVGLKHFIIAPKPEGALTYCKSAYRSLYGQIRSEWRKNEKGGLDVLIEIPANTSATFILPDHKSGLKEGSGKNIAVKKVNGSYAAEFTSGTYRLVLE